MSIDELPDIGSRFTFLKKVNIQVIQQNMNILDKFKIL